MNSPHKDPESLNADTMKNFFPHTLTPNQLYHVFDFLSLKDVLVCSYVCKSWKETSEKFCKSLRSFTIRNPADLAMYLKIVHILEIQAFAIMSNLNNGDIPFINILQLLNYVKPTVKVLKIDYNTEDFRYISILFNKLPQVFPSTETFKYYGKKISEIDLMALQHFTHLKEFYLMEDCYLEGVHFNTLPPLETIAIHSHIVRFEYISSFLRASTEKLQKIVLDLEEYETEDLDNLMNILRNCKLLSIDFKYCNNLNGDHLIALDVQPLLRKFALRKTRYISGEAYSKFFENKFPELESILLGMNDGLNTASLISISKGCENLKVLDITWCEEVDSSGIYAVLMNCKNLREISIVGVKKATEKAFPVIKEYYQAENAIKVQFLTAEEKQVIHKELKDIYYEKFGMSNKFSFYQNLRLLDATKCDFIPDDVYLLLLLINPNIEVRNYYGERVSFHKSPQQEINYH